MDLAKEREIVEKAKANVQFFSELYDTYFDQIYLYVLKRVGNVEFAEDISSKTFLKAIEKISKFNSKKNVSIKSWFYRIAYNIIVDEYRKNKKIDSLSNDFDVQSNVDVEKEVHLELVNKDLKQCLDNIKDRYREVLYLKYFSELENDEIAEVIKLRKQQVPVLVYRAHEALKKEYKKQFPENKEKSEIYFN